ncbi:MAG: hypothetical protein QMD36_03915 [Candidatus Aenigmarchaeota archaeon]|nr:hypothetical protein [Candidatus Aenigmarchaeota archaeon]
MIDWDMIKVLLTPGETENRSIKVTNIGRGKLDITAKIYYLEQFLFFKAGGTEYEFELDLNETKEVGINFFAKKDQEPGVYPGKIVFTGGPIERIVLIVVEVESEKPLFDVKVEVLPEYRIVYPGDKVLAQLTIYNLGRIGRVDVNVEYGVKDLSGSVIISGNEILAVETQVSVVKTINLPSTIKPDDYVFYSVVNYNHVIGTGSDMFRVIEKMKFRIPTLYVLLILIIFAILVLILIIYKLRKKRRVKKYKPIKKKRK